MHDRNGREQELIAKIRDLSAGRVAEGEDFVDFVRARDERRDLVQAAAVLSEPSLAAVWDNPDDDVYNSAQADRSGTVAATGTVTKRAGRPSSDVSTAEREQAMTNGRSPVTPTP